MHMRPTLEHGKLTWDWIPEKHWPLPSSHQLPIATQVVGEPREPFFHPCRKSERLDFMQVNTGATSSGVPTAMSCPVRAFHSMCHTLPLALLFPATPSMTSLSLVGNEVGKQISHLISAVWPVKNLCKNHGSLHKKKKSLYGQDWGWQ